VHREPVPRRHDRGHRWRLFAALLLAVGALVWVAPAALADDPIPAPVITAPTMSSPAFYGSPLVFTGTGAVAGDHIAVTVSGAPACDFDVVTTGSWSCTSTGGPLEFGFYSAQAVQTLSDLPPGTGEETPFSVVIPPPVIDGAPITSPVSAALTIAGTGVAGEGRVSISLGASDGTNIALCTSVAVDESGDWSCPVPAGTLTIGRYSLSGTQSVSDGMSEAATTTVTITADAPPKHHHKPAPPAPPAPVVAPVVAVATPTPTPTATPIPTPTPTAAAPIPAARPTTSPSAGGNGHGGSSSTPERDRPGAPNSLSTSLQPVWVVVSDPVALGSSLALGIAFLVVVGLPAELARSAMKDRYATLQRRPRRSPTWLAPLASWFTGHPVLSGVLLVAAATVISGFADPKLGFDIASLRLLIASFVAALLVSYATYVATAKILLARWGVTVTLSLRPFALVITLVGVVVSRVLDFTPGFLFGLMLGLVFAVDTSRAIRSHSRIIRLGLILGTALVSWGAYSLFFIHTSDASLGFSLALLRDVLAALSTQGLTSLLIAMLPLAYLDGRDVWRYSRRLWALCYAATATAFALVVVPKTSSWAVLGARITSWGIALGVFCVIAVGVYLGIRLLDRRETARRAAEQPVEPERVES
jgi:hypothetical protein